MFDAPVEHDDSEGYYAGIVSGVGWLDCLKLGVNISFLGGNSYVFLLDSRKRIHCFTGLMKSMSLQF